MSNVFSEKAVRVVDKETIILTVNQLYKLCRLDNLHNMIQIKNFLHSTLLN